MPLAPLPLRDSIVPTILSYSGYLFLGQAERGASSFKWGHRRQQRSDTGLRACTGSYCTRYVVSISLGFRYDVVLPSVVVFRARFAV